MKIRILRLSLFCAAAVWGVSIVGVFASWNTLENILQGLGSTPIAHDPMLDYWLRMASGAFALIGAWFLILAIWPRKFHVAIPWFGLFMLWEGLILLVHGLRLSLPSFPFYGDVAGCLITGIAILFLAGSARPEKNNGSST